MQRRERHLGGARRGRARPPARGRSAARCRAACRCRTARSSRTSTGGTTGVKPVLLEQRDTPTARAPARAARAAPSGTTKRDPDTRAPRARGRGGRRAAPRGLRPVAPASPTSRITSSSSGALGSGRFGSAASTSARRSSSVRSSSSSPFSRSDTPRTSAIASEASSPLRWSSPIRLLAWFFARPQVLQLRQQRPAPLVQLERLVEHRRVHPATRERLTRRLRVRADLPEVEHRDPLRRASLLLPEYLSRKSATSSRLAAGHDVRGHDRAREAAVADGEERVLARHVAHVEVRAVRALAALELAGRLRPVGVRLGEGVAAGAALVEELGAAVRGLIALRDLDLPAAAGEQGGREQAADCDRTRHGAA